jgi:triphosphoribosyl-dephospho-CoA synthase
VSIKDLNLSVSIQSIDDLLRCINLASLLELAGWPKPGNIHRTRDFENTRFEHFLIGITAIQPNFRRFCEKVYNSSIGTYKNFSYIELGLFFKETTSQMMKWQKGGNVLLGHILILGPLAAAACLCLKETEPKYDNFQFFLNSIIEDSTTIDTINLYEAIRSCNPGGLGKIDKYDIYDENSLKDIEKDKINLKRIFELSKDYDLISSEYASGFNITLNEGLVYFLDSFKKYYDINIATVNTYLKLLSQHPDTLVIRKAGLDPALKVSNKALQILQKGGISQSEGLELTFKLDNELQKEKGKMNPGTTADIVTGVIFCALIFGLRF